MKKTVAFYTLGCKLNYSETSTISEEFVNNGFTKIDFFDKADVYVINTCTVTENAEKDCRQIVRRALRQNPNAYIIVTGCYAQLRADEISKMDGVDAVLGSNEKFKIFDLIQDFTKEQLSCIYVNAAEHLNDFNSAFSTDSDDRTRAYFKIQDGCDYKCTFCTIPLARGKSRSLAEEIAVKQFTELVDKGYKEIILTGVNVGDYGKNNDSNLYSLLKKLIAVDGEFRIRISSIEPNLLTEEILDLVAQNKKMCNHFHIPLQSGSDKMLKLMQRRYNTSDYKSIILKAVNKIKEVGIGVDVIIGSPGETEEDFLDTYNFLKELPISYLHVFSYSERPNTKAILMEDKVSAEDKKRRSAMLRILGEKLKNKFYRNMIGTEQKVLFEDSEKDTNIFGFTSNYVKVKYPFHSDLANNFKIVKIKNVNENICSIEELEPEFKTTEYSL
ncbi:MAG: tRNA (N(6)-L-threonylcarbamoyladenosine(37)-C(2))-methylthiotransferase MtaB [Ignavibacteriales bacterium]|nr:tRNA (N(6)-L-threonylcarbamoyladenosine(37)-C(2))-methylthiotransferase MtaB [Ignavibacteriales bacterium]MCB9219035.1 tRNA (N(6)-L-threonylcarbamoyladenosine(37)-C(2))-methylthiotransferase MtaB [Ignavibacteriales bacterium]